MSSSLLLCHKMFHRKNFSWLLSHARADPCTQGLPGTAQSRAQTMLRGPHASCQAARAPLSSAAAPGPAGERGGVGAGRVHCWGPEPCAHHAPNSRSHRFCSGQMMFNAHFAKHIF